MLRHFAPQHDKSSATFYESTIYYYRQLPILLSEVLNNAQVQRGNIPPVPEPFGW